MSPDRPPRSGLLVAIVGPSGAGKDTVAQLALEGLGTEAGGIRLARRVVTRDADGASENHDSLDEADFVREEARGAFCLSWRANGLAYALPASVREDVDAGAVILANLSRRSLGEAARCFGRIAIVEISARTELLLARITARGRESPAEIAARLERRIPTEAPEGAIELLRIDNSGAPEEAADELRTFLRNLLHSLEKDPSAEPSTASAEPSGSPLAVMDRRAE